MYSYYQTMARSVAALVLVALALSATGVLAQDVSWVPAGWDAHSVRSSRCRHAHRMGLHACRVACRRARESLG